MVLGPPAALLPPEAVLPPALLGSLFPPPPQAPSVSIRLRARPERPKRLQVKERSGTMAGSVSEESVRTPITHPDHCQAKYPLRGRRRARLQSNVIVRPCAVSVATRMTRLTRSDARVARARESGAFDLEARSGRTSSAEPVAASGPLPKILGPRAPWARCPESARRWPATSCRSLQEDEWRGHDSKGEWLCRREEILQQGSTARNRGRRRKPSRVLSATRAFWTTASR